MLAEVSTQMMTGPRRLADVKPNRRDGVLIFDL
jgi:hypothetical protein